MNMNRFSHIDIAKGIGILAVIGLHTGFHVEAWIGWEMPLFFFLSGVFANPNKKRFILSRVNRLLIPACFFYVPIFLYNCAYYWIHKDVISLYDSFANCAIPSALWFLIALFYISIIHKLIFRLLKNKLIHVIIALLFFVVGYMLSYCRVPQYAFVNTSITSCSYYLFGNLFSSEVKRMESCKGYVSFIVGILCLLASYFLYNTDDNNYIFYRNNELNAYIYIVMFVAIFGILGILMISVACSRIKILSNIFSYFGKNSLLILCSHLYVLKIIQFCHLFSVLQFGIVVACMPLAIYLLKRFFPRLSGCQPLIKYTHNEEIAH